ncbi:MAG TPA: hypothetical protein PK370_01100 [Candidatus Woesebacteria bacterium]|nr:hypothetical protein [Candidatus Woesebacteria bacterium]HPJ17478.1 hypothetical protein [Candidatus Woesebacteria bacterium]
MNNIFNFLKPSAVNAQGLVGSISNPLPKYPSTDGSGLFLFLSNILKFAGTIAGIYMLIQIIIAGYTYISASGDPKKTDQAWAQIWQSLLGIVIIASAFTIASVIEKITGINIINPVIYGP